MSTHLCIYAHIRVCRLTHYYEYLQDNEISWHRGFCFRMFSFPPSPPPFFSFLFHLLHFFVRWKPWNKVIKSIFPVRLSRSQRLRILLGLQLWCEHGIIKWNKMKKNLSWILQEGSEPTSGSWSGDRRPHSPDGRSPVGWVWPPVLAVRLAAHFKKKCICFFGFLSLSLVTEWRKLM